MGDYTFPINIQNDGCHSTVTMSFLALLLSVMRNQVEEGSEEARWWSNWPRDMDVGLYRRTRTMDLVERES